MATKIKIVTTKDFLEVTPEGVIDIDSSRRLLVEIARSKQKPVDYDLLIDFRDTTWNMSTFELYHLASVLTDYGDTFRRKVAILVLAGVTFDKASFLETCSHNQGFQVDAFSDYETAIRWLLSSSTSSDTNHSAAGTDSDDDD
ncbi:MAG TPA: hypothetical protein VKA53_07380 [Thermoanaerobaculia bacterium]|nr:hypothetical protein [Thermoanaerobaculia bacterium]